MRDYHDFKQFMIQNRTLTPSNVTSSTNNPHVRGQHPKQVRTLVSISLTW